MTELNKKTIKKLEKNVEKKYNSNNFKYKDYIKNKHELNDENAKTRDLIDHLKSKRNIIIDSLNTDAKQKLSKPIKHAILKYTERKINKNKTKMLQNKYIQYCYEAKVKGSNPNYDEFMEQTSNDDVLSMTHE